MSGGAVGQAGEGSDTVSSALQNYPIVPNSAGGAQASAAGANPQAQSLSQLQQALQKLGAKGPQGQPSAAMQVGNMGQQLMQAGQQPRPQMQAPMSRPVGMAGPMQAAQPPQMNGNMGMQQGGMTPQMMNMLLARQNGLMG